MASFIVKDKTLTCGDSKLSTCARLISDGMVLEKLVFSATEIVLRFMY